MGDHAVCCVKNNITSRHNRETDTLAHLATSAQIPVTREVTVPQTAPDGTQSPQQLRPADLLLGMGSTGKLAVDVTVIHSLAPSQHHSDTGDVMHQSGRELKDCPI